MEPCKQVDTIKNIEIRLAIAESDIKEIKKDIKEVKDDIKVIKESQEKVIDLSKNMELKVIDKINTAQTWVIGFLVTTFLSLATFIAMHILKII